MTRSLLVLMVLAALAAAAVMPIHRDRRALPDDKTGVNSSSKIQCDPETPCGWTVLKPNTKIVDLNLSNSYCVCRPELLCIQTEYDTRMSSYVHRCRSEAEAKLIHFDDS